MATVLMTDPATGRVAIFDEAPGGGDPADPNALRNRPLNSPAAWLAKVFFHSDFDYYEVVAGPTNVAITHPTVAGKTTETATLPKLVHYGQTVVTHHTLLAHGLGYVPSYMVITGSMLLPPCTRIQADGAGTLSSRSRWVTPYATTSAIRLMDVGHSSDVALAAMAATYGVVVFKQPAFSNNYLFDFDPASGRVRLGKGKFDSAVRRLRLAGAAGDSPYDIPLGPTIDIANGRTRVVLPDGSVLSESGYDGGFAGPSTFQGAIA